MPFASYTFLQLFNPTFYKMSVKLIMIVKNETDCIAKVTYRYAIVS